MEKDPSKTGEKFSKLRSLHHSVHEKDRAEALSMLAAMKDDPDASRQLIMLFEDCEWRQTKFAVLQALSNHTNVRALEFLFGCALKEDDLPIAELAIWALGRTGERSAARFLTRLHGTCAESLAPVVIGALGEIGEQSVGETFLKDLERAVAAKSVALIRNLVLALGNLKVTKAEPLFLKLLQDENLSAEFSATQIPAALLISLGKISRKPDAFAAFGGRFARDSLLSQIFQSSLNQIRFRSTFTLEDYLQKMFEDMAAHPFLPLEFNEFDEKDVYEGLKLFSDSKYTSKMLTVLSKLTHPKAVSWYEELCGFSKIQDPALLVTAIESLSWHRTQASLSTLKKIQERVLASDSDDGVFWAYFEALGLIAIDPCAEFLEIFKSDKWKEWSSNPRKKTAVISHFIGALLVSKEQDRALKILDGLLEQEKDSDVRARTVRGAAQLGLKSEKILEALTSLASDATRFGSFFYYCERVTDKKIAKLLYDLAPKFKGRGPEVLAALFSALTAQEKPPENTPAIDGLLSEALDAKPEGAVEALRFLGRHPRPGFADRCTEWLGNPETSIHAIIALKALGKEEHADQLAPLLSSGQPSIAGRALDTLCTLPGMRPKRLVIDALRENAEDREFCDKVIRSLAMPESGAEYFTAVLDEIVKKYPEHPQKDGLTDLRERLIAHKRAASKAGGVGVAGIGTGGKADQELEKEIPAYAKLDESVKSALRSAEQMFLHPELYQGSVDKASSVLEYCKALDLFLEKHYGRRFLFPKLETSLHDFQNVVHACGLAQDYPSAEKLIQVLGLSSQFSPQSMPSHKMGLVAQAILSGRIVNDRFKTLDGLRAWSVMLLLFSRKISEPKLKALLPLTGLTDEKTAAIAKRLMLLQDIRNPAAHRQTFLEFVGVDEVRSEVFSLFRDLEVTM